MTAATVEAVGTHKILLPEAVLSKLRPNLFPFFPSFSVLLPLGPRHGTIKEKVGFWLADLNREPSGTRQWQGDSREGAVAEVTLYNCLGLTCTYMGLVFTPKTLRTERVGTPKSRSQTDLWVMGMWDWSR